MKIVIFAFTPTAGVAFLTFGLLRDARGSWAAWPYATNMFTALTGACFGIPLAIGVLQEIASQQADRAQWKITRRMLVVNVADISDSLHGAYRATLAELRAVSALMRHCHLRPTSIYDSSEKGGSPSVLVLAEIRHLVDAHIELEDWMRKIAIDRQLANVLEGQYSAAWDFLDGQVRARLLESGAPWLPRDVYVKLRSSCSINVVTFETLLPEVSSRIEYSKRFLSSNPVPSIYEWHNSAGYYLSAVVNNLTLAASSIDNLIEKRELLVYVENLVAKS
jgi:hypothetical protein